MAAGLDRLGRPLRNLRISVTDRCNLRCQYCMPEEEYVWLPRNDILHFEEISRLVDLFVELGVRRVRLTGGEPLLRRDLPHLVGLLAAKPQIEDLALTTNGILLAAQARELRDAGLHRLTVSLDTLRRERFVELTRRDSLGEVMRGIETVRGMGWGGLKLDAVVIRGTNDDEIEDLLAYAGQVGAELRFIEYMDVGGATRWSPERVVGRAEILDRLARRFGPIEPIEEESSAPADRFRLAADGRVFGIISSTTAPFCRACDRARLTADGLWFLCLYAQRGINLREPLRAGLGAEEVKALIAAGWQTRADRGAEQRLSAAQRSALAHAEHLRENPHLEMHTRGG